jgi:hypothetical protein
MLGNTSPAIGSKMKSTRYTAEQAEEIVNRIIDARLRWLRVVNIQLAQQGRPGPGDDAGTDVAQGISPSAIEVAKWSQQPSTGP